MNVREDKMTNHWGLQIGKPSLTCCVPVLLIVSRRLKHENILLHVVIGGEYHNPLKNVAYFIISDLFQDIILIKTSCFWKMKVNCANAGLIFFLADKVTPTCLFLHTDYHYPYDFMSGNVGTYIYILPCFAIIAFCQLLTLRSILWGVFPW